MNSETIKRIAKLHLHPKNPIPEINQFNIDIYDFLENTIKSTDTRRTIASLLSIFVIHVLESDLFGADTKNSRTVLMNTGSIIEATEMQKAMDNIALRSQ